LYGRGAADDGYAVFSSLTAIAALKEQKIKLARCVLLIEACEEKRVASICPHTSTRWATPSAIRHSSCVSTPNAAITTRSGALHRCGEISPAGWRVRVLTEGVHSGMATGNRANPVSDRVANSRPGRKPSDGRPAARGTAGEHPQGSACPGHRGRPGSGRHGRRQITVGRGVRNRFPTIRWSSSSTARGAPRLP